MLEMKTRGEKKKKRGSHNQEKQKEKKRGKVCGLSLRNKSTCCAHTVEKKKKERKTQKNKSCSLTRIIVTEIKKKEIEEEMHMTLWFTFFFLSVRK